MNASALLATIRSRPDVAEILSWPFDFQVAEEAVSTRLPVLDGNRCYRLVARDAGGGEFLLCDSDLGGDGALLYLSADGEAGVVGSDLAEGLALILSLPTWRDVLRFSEGGSLEAMRAAAPGLETELEEDEPELESRRTEALSALKLARLADPVEVLHQNLARHAASHRASAPDGRAYGSLFGAPASCGT